MQYYKCLAKRLELEISDEPTIVSTSDGASNATGRSSLSDKYIHSKIKMKIRTPDLESFMKDVDSDYKDAMT